MTNLYVVYADGGARTYCLGAQEAQSVKDRYHSDDKDNVRVAFVSALQDVTRDFE